jgi:hypothetical protein
MEILTQLHKIILNNMPTLLEEHAIETIRARGFV